MSIRALAAALLVLAVTASEASAAVKPPYSRAGGWVTDATGRVFISHGVNMVYKVAPYAPAASGFGEDDAAFLEAEGFNSVRLGVIYKAVEPEPGHYDDAYLDKIAATAAILEKHGIAPLVDFHQDMYNERFQGEGWPDWAVLDDGMPAEPKSGFPGNYLAMPGLNRAFDNFWANAAGPGGPGLGDRYAQAWKHVAERFAADRAALGYDLLNEPWPGNGWQECANPAGCPTFDQGPFADFYKRTIAGVRQGDKNHLVFYEPAVLFNFGSDTNLPKLDDPHVAMSWHVYCLAGAIGGPGGSDCDTSERLPFMNAQKRTKNTGDPTFVTEFGATEDLDTIHRIVTDADEYMVGWQYWHYCGCNDPTTQGPGDTQAIVKDPAKPPTGSNLKSAKLDVLVRPYPQLIAGTPKSWSFDPDKKVFSLDWLTARAGGGSFAGSPATEVFVPKRQYPNGYVAQVQNGTIGSAPGSGLLLLNPCHGAREVKVAVMKAGAGQSAVGCPAFGVAGVKAGLPKLSLSVRPRRVRAGHRVTFRFRVHSGRFAVSGARIRFAGHSIRTGANGTAKLRVRLRRAGPRRAVTWKRAFRHGQATVRVTR